MEGRTTGRIGGADWQVGHRATISSCDMIDPSAEQSLLSAAVAGDQAAVQQLLLSYYAPLERHVEPRIPPHARRHFSVDDIVQQVFSQVFRDVQRFEPRGEGVLRLASDNCRSSYN